MQTLENEYFFNYNKDSEWYLQEVARVKPPNYKFATNVGSRMGFVVAAVKFLLGHDLDESLVHP